MKNGKTALILLAISVITMSALIPVALIAAEDIVIYRPYNWKIKGPFTEEGTDFGLVRGQLEVGPLFTYEYVSIGGTLNTNQYNQYGPYYPYAVSVKINSVSPSGRTLTVVIKVNGTPQWSGELGAGQSSPTITANGGTTYVKITNNNDVTVTYTGTITLIYN
jgi:hypothetical protein